MDHEFIEALMKLYSQLPHNSPEGAAERVAVLIEMELEAMEKSGETISRNTLLEKINAAIKLHLDSAA